MKYFFKLLLISFCTFTLSAQQFSFELYLEDSLGYKDTVVIGLDPEASTGIDPAFGEEDIKNVPFSENFEVRVAEYIYDYWTEWFCFEPIEDFSAFHSKTQIFNGNCYIPLDSIPLLLLSQAQFPVKVSWNKELFNDSCYQETIITDWDPKVWFDATCTSHFVHYLSQQDSAFLTPSPNLFLDQNGDTLHCYFVGSAVYSSLDEVLEKTDVKLYPNPATEKVSITFPSQARKEATWELYNSIGYPIKSVTIQAGKTEVTIWLNTLPVGMYYWRLNCRNRILGSGKLIVK